SNLYIIHCPFSPYCKHRPKDYPMILLRNADLEEAAAMDIFRRSQDVRTSFKVRVRTTSITQELLLENYMNGYTLLGYDRISTFFGKGILLPLISPNPGQHQNLNYKREKNLSDWKVNKKIPLLMLKSKILTSIMVTDTEKYHTDVTINSISKSNGISYYPIWNASPKGVALVAADPFLNISHLPFKLQNAARQSLLSPIRPAKNEFTLDLIYQT
ncbi:unnamed protein product, partial [Meganyctiphanes norvegica]